MGFLLASGHGVPADPAAALVYFFFAASANRTAAQAALGCGSRCCHHRRTVRSFTDCLVWRRYRHLYGWGVPRSASAAALYYSPAATAALTPSPTTWEGPPGSPPPVERVRLTREHASASAARARERELVHFYRHAADGGGSDAAAAVGQLLASGGRGGGRDYVSAAKYLTRAAAAGDAGAAATLGTMHAYGLGVALNSSKAMALFASAAEKGHSGGQAALGAALLSEVHAYHSLAAQHHARAAAAAAAQQQRAGSGGGGGGGGGFAPNASSSNPPPSSPSSSSSTLPPLPPLPPGPPPSSAPGLRWLGAAAEQGSPEAHALLGALSASGAHGVARDPLKATLHLSAASAAGHAGAQAQLARMQLAGAAATSGGGGAGATGVTHSVQIVNGQVQVVQHALAGGAATADGLLGGGGGGAAAAAHGASLPHLPPGVEAMPPLAHAAPDASAGAPPAASSPLHPGASAVVSRHNAASSSSAAVREEAPRRAAVEALKSVAERSPAVAGCLEAAHDAWTRGDEPLAVRLYARCAHAGIELAQWNLGWLLERRSEALSRRSGASSAAAAAEAASEALLWRARSAEQGHVPSLVAVGDAHWFGRGTRADAAAAGAAYAAAASARSPRALFNLGAMHLSGSGLPRDLHLAKRYFDAARDAGREARVPAAIALAAIRAAAARDAAAARVSRLLGPRWGGHAGGSGENGGALAVAPPQQRAQAGAGFDAEAALLAALCAALAAVVRRIRRRRAQAAEAAAGGGARGGHEHTHED